MKAIKYLETAFGLVAMLAWIFILLPEYELATLQLFAVHT